MDLKERIKNRIAESRQLMVTAKFPHIYYQAVGTRKLEQILEEEFEISEKPVNLKIQDSIDGMIHAHWSCGSCGHGFYGDVSLFKFCPICGTKYDWREASDRLIEQVPRET